ncbi:ADP-ribose glycohydrolase MACROD2-like [Lineus longissimus]|uniref:ADP-ribose glycohydrolase MACROD2-like n=1 Tax=Lineus longissimus TaxID=88925 RepID=UPI002B4DF001
MHVIQKSNFHRILRHQGHVAAANHLIRKLPLFGWFRPGPAPAASVVARTLSLSPHRDLHSFQKIFCRHNILLPLLRQRVNFVERQISTHCRFGRQSRRRNYLLLGQPLFIVLVLSQFTLSSRTEGMDKFFWMSPKKSRSSKGGSEKSADGGEFGDDEKLNPKHVTRAQLWQKEKEKYLNMPIEEKRLVYKCKDKYLTIDDVLTWPQFAEENDIQPARKSKILFPYDANINAKVSIWRGDITRLEIDSIANAANSSLLGGGGVDGAIHSAAGRNLFHENNTLNGCECGNAKISGGYKLPARYIISTVGPMGHNEAKLRSCYTRCLEVMLKNKLRSLALPCISTGIYGYPNEDAAVVAMETVRMFLEEHGDKVDRIIFCLFLEKDVNIYSEFMPQYFPLESEKEVESDQVVEDTEQQDQDNHETKGGSEPTPESEAEPKPETGTEPKPESVTEPKPEKNGTEPKPENGTDSKPETGTEPKPESVTEPKPESVTEPKPENETEPKPETKTERSSGDTEKPKGRTKTKPKVGTKSKSEVEKEAKL